MSSTRKQRIVVGLSGGVDSAVSALLLKRAGHEVVGIFMKNWEDDDRPAGAGDDDSGSCSSNADFVDAAAVADVIGIEIEHVNFAADYKDRVFSAFLAEYRALRTPNPDVLCNAEIKFKAFLDHAMRLGADAIATGHYARTRVLPGDATTRPATTGEVQLLRGLDANKDQSYFLHRLTQTQLRSVIFPVGELPKREVRRIAAEAGLANAAKRDSTGICFIGERPFREFLSRYLHHQPGDIVDERGRRLGAHVGLAFYTLGQRQGLGVGGVKGRADAQGHHGAWYVAAKDLARNRLVVVQGHEHPWLQATALDATDASWIAGTPPADRVFGVKTRYRQADGPGALRAMPSASFTLEFGAHPQWAATPGQSAVLYDGQVCLGGGVIDAVRKVAAQGATDEPIEATLR